MKIYAVIWQDAQIDIEVYLFSDPDHAVEWAKDRARKQAAEWDEEIDEELDSDMVADGWLYYGGYNDEIDCYRVQEIEVDKEIGG